MASGGSLPPNFLLTPHQQSLLFAALNANKPQTSASPTAKGLSLSPSSFQGSPMQNVDNSAFQESPYLDNIDYDFGDSSFDFSFASNGGEQLKMVADAPGTVSSESTENDGHEKRSHPDDEEDDSSPGNDSKRREGTEKIAKKPGRKPLTSEPTSKRKAQNRAAQRAFRERKEKHLKDLETKVDELEKASEAANHENSKLRAEVDRITSELNQYKQRVAVMSQHKPTPRDKVSFGSAALNNLSDVSFQFEFPKFGALPGPPIKQPSSQPLSPQQRGQKNSPARSIASEGKSPQSSVQQSNQDDFAKFAGVFAPSMSNSTRTGSRASVDSVPFSVAAATSSPSASSNSNAGPSSSCGTSPEPFTQSPMSFKPLETLTTIGEEQPTTATADQPFAQFAHVDIASPSFDWLVQQNGGGHFDPQLFGDYRESQENVLSNPSFDDVFFNDGLDADFFTPYNAAPNEHAPKKNLIAEIDAQQNSIDDDMGNKPNMSCNQLWEKLQECPKAQNGEFDLDGLCSELTKKAKCSGSGPVVAERDFDTILKKYMGKDVSADCMASKLGISVDPEKPNGVTTP
ncbi:bZIP transcription factor [Metarhizium robertsii]|uniref:Transcription factor n=2 Tax=Metarhizium robertsii TaxID=568076 RepID=E9EQU4_METRA|nr:transcription factor [Metarhizium robertsii ARSEF 23]EFZ02600.2 transcription factor [Metarhizium robertsii ARSEF 23]EXV05808.1 bZIP transcription factor [Metarhizium robertsii]